MSGLREHHLQVLRTARYYALGSPNAPECWLVCHGFGQLAARFIRGFQDVAGEERFVVAPEAPHRFYLDPADRPAPQRRVGATWMTREDRETDIADYIAYLDAVYEATCAGARSVHVLGFSQGVATVARWAAATPHRIDRLILWGSLLPPDLDWSAAEQRLCAMDVQLVMGTTDEFADAAKVRDQLQLARTHGLTITVTEFEGGHVIDSATLQKMVQKRG